MSRLLTIEPLTREAFAPFGTIIEADPATMRYINGGNTERFHGLARADVVGEGANVIINIFRGQPRAFPYVVNMMERHPLPHAEGRGHGEDEDGRPGTPRVFQAGGRQGVNYGRNVWHHPLMSIGAVSDFLIVDREGPGNNLEEYFYDEPFVISSPV